VLAVAGCVLFRGSTLSAAKLHRINHGGTNGACHGAERILAGDEIELPATSRGWHELRKTDPLGLEHLLQSLSEDNWRRIERIIREDEDSTSAAVLVDMFRCCSDERVRRSITRSLADSPRDLVAMAACEVIATTGAGKNDAKRFWKVHDRLKHLRHRRWMLECIGLTGDLSSVDRLVEIASLPPSTDLRGQKVDDGLEWCQWVRAADDAIFMIVGEPETSLPKLSTSTEQRRRALQDALERVKRWKTATPLRAGKEMIEDFILRLRGPKRMKAQFALMRLTGQYPIGLGYFWAGVAVEYPEQRWKEYQNAWVRWWKDNKQSLRWNKNHQCVMAQRKPPPALSEFASKKHIIEEFKKMLPHGP